MTTSSDSHPTAAWVSALSICAGVITIAAGMMVYISSHTLGTVLLVAGAIPLAAGLVIALFVDFRMSELEPSTDLFPLGPHTFPKEQRRALKAAHATAQIPQQRAAGRARTSVS